MTALREPMNRWHPGAAAMLGAVSMSLACGTDDQKAESDETDPDTMIRTPPPNADGWERETVSTERGVALRLALDGGGRPTLAYFADTARSGDRCTELGEEDTVDKTYYDLYYAVRGSGSWAEETVTELLSVGVPAGFDMKTAPDGTPHIASLTGEPIALPPYCGANDVALFTRSGAGSWSADTAIQTSGEAPAEGAGSNAGEVVGYWPALAFAPDGAPVIAYKDVHTGGVQADDRTRADMEMAWGGAGWTALMVDEGRGAGNYTRLLFDGQGRVIVVYFNPAALSGETFQGLWAARSEDQGTTWDHVQLYAGPLQNGPDALVHSDGTLYVAFYDPKRSHPSVRFLPADSEFADATSGWSAFSEVGDPSYDEGHSPSLAETPNGNLALAYRRCARPTAAGSCDAREDGLVFALRGSDGRWSHELVDAGDDGGVCGALPSLAFDASGHAVVGYFCDELDGDVVTSRVRLASRKEPL